MESTVKERLEFFLKSKKISKTNFGKAIGVSNSFVSSIRKSIAPDKIQSIADNWPELNIEWLMTGEGQMLKPQSANSVSVGSVSGNGNNFVAGNNNQVGAVPEPRVEDAEIIKTLEAVPVLSHDQVKAPNFDVKRHVDSGSKQIQRLPIAQILAKFGEFEVVSPTYRDSMIPAYMPGDFLFVQYKRDWDNTQSLKQGIYLIDMRIHGSILCMAEDMGDGTLKLSFKNSKKYKPMVIPKDIVLSVATVSFLIRMGDMAFDVEDTAYLQHLLDCQIDQYNQLMVQYGKTGDRVSRVIDQNQQLIDTLIGKLKKE